MTPVEEGEECEGKGEEEEGRGEGEPGGTAGSAVGICRRAWRESAHRVDGHSVRT